MHYLLFSGVIYRNDVSHASVVCRGNENDKSICSLKHSKGRTPGIQIYHSYSRLIEPKQSFLKVRVFPSKCLKELVSQNTDYSKIQVIVSMKKKESFESYLKDGSEADRTIKSTIDSASMQTDYTILESKNRYDDRCDENLVSYTWEFDSSGDEYDESVKSDDEDYVMEETYSEGSDQELDADPNFQVSDLSESEGQESDMDSEISELSEDEDLYSAELRRSVMMHEMFGLHEGSNLELRVNDSLENEEDLFFNSKLQNSIIEETKFLGDEKERKDEKGERNRALDRKKNAKVDMEAYFNLTQIESFCSLLSEATESQMFDPQELKRLGQSETHQVFPSRNNSLFQPNPRKFVSRETYDDYKMPEWAPENLKHPSDNIGFRIGVYHNLNIYTKEDGFKMSIRNVTECRGVKVRGDEDEVRKILESERCNFPASENGKFYAYAYSAGRYLGIRGKRVGCRVVYLKRVLHFGQKWSHPKLVPLLHGILDEGIEIRFNLQKYCDKFHIDDSQEVALMKIIWHLCKLNIEIYGLVPKQINMLYELWKQDPEKPVFRKRKPQYNKADISDVYKVRPELAPGFTDWKYFD